MGDFNPHDEIIQRCPADTAACAVCPAGSLFAAGSAASVRGRHRAAAEHVNVHSCFNGATTS